MDMPTAVKVYHPFSCAASDCVIASQKFMEKDTIIAVLGAAVSLAGIVLVFSGLVLAQKERMNQK